MLTIRSESKYVTKNIFNIIEWKLMMNVYASLFRNNMSVRIILENFVSSILIHHFYHQIIHAIIWFFGLTKKSYVNYKNCRKKYINLCSKLFFNNAFMYLVSYFFDWFTHLAKLHIAFFFLYISWTSRYILSLKII